MENKKDYMIWESFGRGSSIGFCRDYQSNEKFSLNDDFILSLYNFKITPFLECPSSVLNKIHINRFAKGIL